MGPGRKPRRPVFSERGSFYFAAWTVWLWLGASLNEDPSKVWKQTGSPYNDANPMNVSDLVSSGANAYRSENVDSWDTNVPDLVSMWGP